MMMTCGTCNKLTDHVRLGMNTRGQTEYQCQVCNGKSTKSYKLEEKLLKRKEERKNEQSNT